MVDKNLKKLFAVYNSDTPVILKQGQSHQIWYELVEPKQECLKNLAWTVSVKKLTITRKFL